MNPLPNSPLSSLVADPKVRPPEIDPTSSTQLAKSSDQLKGSPRNTYLGIMNGPSEPLKAQGQQWIHVGSSDIIASCSCDIKSLNLSPGFKDKLCQPWTNSVVVRLLGKTIGYAYLCHQLKSMWRPSADMHIVDLDKSCFLVKFAVEQDYYKALTGGHWILLDHYLIAHQWEPSFRVSNDLPKKMVAWVRFPHLPIHFYHGQVLTSLGNLIGRTIKIDFNTQRAEWGKFACIAVEIDLGAPLPPVVVLDGAIQKVEYENLPTLCFGCGRVGHDQDNCPSKPTLEATKDPPKL
ncbi:hypothetical protein LINPERHAP1_LOCUS31541 [Linum perenne]